ncbi:nuclear transport factor 2 family protein [Brachybacterium kimchii]|uniref:Nuclear transport factor 2 family protein n=1 Tax=Brachybacterium kimchii TaxID=2942909 RepID=A0ABY4N4G5_9MICO|nr:nuclear transport factor 2 family protein [Brachybacterium kimchii]UQN28250.1 nuclear transport factor 2 family protein [Brachybacterium kimchii]
MNTIDQTIALWADAERGCDARTTETLLTEDFQGIGPVGFQLSRDAWIGRLSSGDLRYDELSLNEVTIREHGDCALVIARLDVRGEARGHPLPTTRTTFSVVSVGGDWRIAGIQHSFIAGAPGSPVPGPR